MANNTPVVGGIGNFFSWLGGNAQSYNQYSNQAYANYYHTTSFDGIMNPSSSPAKSPQQYATNTGQAFSNLGTATQDATQALNPFSSANLGRDILIGAGLVAALLIVGKEL